jgi:murein L,D-transpeptidase YcbB/YkuD
VISVISAADGHGLRPQDYDLQTLRTLVAAAVSGRATDLAKAEAALSRAYAAYIVDLREPPEAARPAFIDAQLDRPRLTARGALEELARAPTLEAGLQAAQAMNPVYEGLRTTLAEYHAQGGGPHERLILANLARARALPQDLGRRYILVDVAAARLQAYEDGALRDSMDVVVGKPSQQTPVMTGLIRYAVLNPYWNIPDDLTRDTYAPRVLHQGASYLARERMEVLSDWSDGAALLDPAEVDWGAVAAGSRPVRLRQAPGPHNTMGAVKLMLPNPLGIYLHDTPMKWLFAQRQRSASAGCVRLADAMRLTAWVFGQNVQPTSDAPEQRVDLPEPVPVYITYFTAAPGVAGPEIRADIYGRDATLLAQLAQPDTSGRRVARG